MPRRPGRPPLDPRDALPSASVHLRVPGSQYDTVYALARRDRITVPQFVRRALERECRRADHGDDDEE